MGPGESKAGKEEGKYHWVDYRCRNWGSVFGGTCKNHVEFTAAFSTWDQCRGEYFFMAFTLQWSKVSWGYECPAFYFEATGKKPRAESKRNRMLLRPDTIRPPWAPLDTVATAQTCTTRGCEIGHISKVPAFFTFHWHSLKSTWIATGFYKRLVFCLFLRFVSSFVFREICSKVFTGFR